MTNAYGIEIIKYRNWEIEVFKNCTYKYRVWVNAYYNEFRTQDNAEEFIDYMIDNLRNY